MPRSMAFEIAGRAIGPGEPPYLIAELSGNHMGRLDLALELLEAARDAGADAAKIQTYTADSITIDHHGPGFVIEEGLWAGRTLYDLYKEAETPLEWHPELFAKARSLGITLFSSPFDAAAVELLESLDTPAYKIASLEIVDLPLVGCAAATGKPLIMSTGLATKEEIEEAVAVARRAGCRSLALLHCVSGYPTPPGESNLRTIGDLDASFDAVIGLSDHSPGTAVSVAAVAAGAGIIEKHFTISRAGGGVDAAFSLEPREFAALATDCRDAFAALGEADYSVKPSERLARGHRRSLYVVQDIAAGETLTAVNVRSIRPGFGLHTRHLNQVIGQQAAGDIRRGTPLAWHLLAAGKPE